MKIEKGFLHIRKILEDKCLIKLRIEIFSVNFGFIFGFLIRQQIDLDKRICEACRPVCWRKVATLYDLKIRFLTTPSVLTG